MKSGFVKISLPIITGILLVIFAVLNFNPKALAVQPDSDNVTICHATASQQNPYSKITVDKNSANGFPSNNNADHGNHNGGVYPTNPWGDIIPPFEQDFLPDYPGKNWNAQGQAIYNNNCNIPASPSPTPAIGGGPSVGGNITTPQCPTDRPQQVDQVWFTDVKPGEVTVNWANKGDAWGFQIQYGPAQNQLIWGVEVSDSKATQYTLKNLPAGDLWVSVIAKSSKECGGPGSDPKVAGQVLGASILGAAGIADSALSFLVGAGSISLGLFLAYKRRLV